jgi:hypothetical protein
MEANTPYFAILQFDFDGDDGDVRGALNASDFVKLPGANKLYPHPDNIGIGAVNGGAVFKDNVGVGGNYSYFNGYFAEFMSGNFVYNSAQLLIMQNYLAAKYNIDLGAKDLYAFDATHNWEVIGIGQKADTSSHNKSQGQGVILITNPSDLDDDEFLFIGHDNGYMTDGANEYLRGLDEWVGASYGIDVPNNDTNMVRVYQEWRVAKVGDVGSINLDIDLRDEGNPGRFAGKDPDFEKYVILLDADGDFTEGATVMELKEDQTLGNEGYYVLENVDFTHGDYFTVGIANTTVGFENAVAEGMENTAGEVIIPVSLNMQCNEPVTVEYAFEADNATEVDDYTASNGTLTFAAGQVTKNIALTIIDDGISEGDEKINVILKNPGNGILTVDTLVYIIHDDDNARKIQFASTAVNVTETEDNAYLVNIELSASAGAEGCEVDYQVTGGTATNGAADDYALSNGTVSISDGNSTGSFTIALNDDVLDEEDETIIIQLSNPSYCSLGSNTSITITIEDNDNAPTVQFAKSSDEGAESYNPVYVEVKLSTKSEKDITVGYQAIDGTAENGGQDYNLPEGILTIPAGDSLGYILPEIINDIIPGGVDKTFSISLLSNGDLTNAILGATNNFDYTIYDDDEMGDEGPGGVGDKKLIKAWYQANKETYSNGSNVGTFNDQSGNGFNATFNTNISGLVRPVYTSNGINSKAALSFGGSAMLELPRNNTDISNAAYTLKTIGIVFETSADITSRQVIYEQGGGRSGLAIFIYNGNIHYAAYNTNAGAWGYEEIVNPIATNTAYSAMLVFDKSDESNNGWLYAYLNGVLIDSRNTINMSLSAPNRTGNGLGGCRNGMRYSATQTTNANTFYFNGKIAEYVHYNFALNEVQRTIAENYFAGKYNLSVGTSVKYSFLTGTNAFPEDIVGIGKLAYGKHISSKGTSLLSIAEPKNWVDGDYLMIGYNGSSDNTWNEISGVYEGTAMFLDRQWRASRTATGLTQIQLGIDITGFDAKPADYPTYIIAVDYDQSDNDMSTNQNMVSVYPLPSPEGSSIRIDTITLTEGTYFRLGVAKNRSMSDGEWHDPNTWLTRTVPGANDVAYISSGQHVWIDAGAEYKCAGVEIEAGGRLDINRNFYFYGDIINQGTLNLAANIYLFIYGTNTLLGSGIYNFGYLSFVCYYGNQEIAGLDYQRILLTKNKSYTISSDLSCKYLFQYYNAIINVIGSPRIELSANWYYKDEIPIFNGGNSTVVFNGSGNQRITVDGRFHNLEVNSGGNVLLNNPISVANTLTLDAGHIDLSNQDLTITNSDPAAVQRTNGYIQATGAGRVIRSVQATGNYEFPIGDASNYTPIEVQLTSSTLGASPTISANLTLGKQSSIVKESSYINRYWTVEPADLTNPTYNLVYQYLDSDLNDGGKEESLRPFKYNATDGVLVGMPDDIDISTNTITWNGLTSFSEISAGDEESLPVELVEFYGEVAYSGINLLWETASELNNDYFEVQRSVDGQHFEVIGKVNGNGTTQNSSNYSFTDVNPIGGDAYYRLRQVDYDGKYEFSKTISVKYDFVASGSEVKVYPNPLNETNLTVELVGFEPNSKVQIKLYNAIGAEIYTRIVLVNSIGEYKHLIDKSVFVEAGLYYINLLGTDNYKNLKVLVK